ncbi:MAG: FkbM family methyltransferase [Elusimicrobia bacterium]|nr:FkbM family methyltransferase [Elusimicrobiota bacterium]
MTDPLAQRRARLLALAADLPARCRLIELSEGNFVLRKLRKLTWFGARYLRWAAARAGLRPGVVEVPLFWGGRMRLPYSEEADFVTLYLAGVPGGPEYKLVRYFIRTLKPGDSFYDAGANYGFYTVLAAEFVGAGGEIHAFEPLPEIAAGLERNSPGPVARIVPAALWDRCGTATLYRHRLGDVFNTLEAEVTDFDPTRGPLRTEVRCTTLDEYAKEHRPPTVIKIDVEGGEKRLIAGGLETFRKARPVIAMEVWAREGGERFSLPSCLALIGLGYAAHALNEDGTTSPLAADDLPAFIRSMPAAWDNLVFLPA